MQQEQEKQIINLLKKIGFEEEKNGSNPALAHFNSAVHAGTGEIDCCVPQSAPSFSRFVQGLNRSYCEYVTTVPWGNNLIVVGYRMPLDRTARIRKEPTDLVSFAFAGAVLEAVGGPWKRLIRGRRIIKYLGKMPPSWHTLNQLFHNTASETSGDLCPANSSLNLPRPRKWSLARLLPWLPSHPRKGSTESCPATPR